MVSVFCRNINLRTRGYDLGALVYNFVTHFREKKNLTI